MNQPSKRQKKTQYLPTSELLTQQSPSPGVSLPDVVVSIRMICREKNLQELHHVQVAVKDYLKQPLRYTVVRLCELGLPLLLQRVIDKDAQESTDSIKRNPRYRQWQFDEGMKAAVVTGNVEVVKVLCVNFPDCRLEARVTRVAAAHGRLEILKWLFANRSDVSKCSDDVCIALEGGHLDMAEWLQIPWNMHTSYPWMRAAIDSGKLEIVEWAYARTVCKNDLVGVVQAASDLGHLQILTWLLERIDTKVDLYLASSGGHFHVVKWMIFNHFYNCGGLYNVMQNAAHYGRLDVLCLLHALKNQSQQRANFLADVKFTTDVMDTAAAFGHLEVVEWLHINHSEGCTFRAMDNAARNGHLEVVKWLHEHRHAGASIAAMGLAATNGHLDVTKWLLENRSEGIYTIAMDQAASNGHLHMVEWLAQNVAVACTSYAMDGAARNGHLNVVKWLHTNRSEGCTTWAMDGAAMNGHLEIVQWLHMNREEGCTIGAMNHAAANGHLDVVRWLHENRTEGCSPVAFSSAMHNHQFAVALFLVMERTESDMATLPPLPRESIWRLLDWLYAHYPEKILSAVLVKFQSFVPLESDN